MKWFSFIFVVIIFFAVLDFPVKSYAQALTGAVERENFLRQKINKIVDTSTGKPVSSAQISIPSKGIITHSDNNGFFSLNADINAPSILSVMADGYKPFTLTLDNTNIQNPLTIGISKKTDKDMIIDSAWHHLGDDNFAPDSANAENFKLKAQGPFFSKKFHIGNINKNQDIILKIGSVVGLDTEMAKRLGQSKVKISVASPARIFLNSKKIANININGDNQEISISSDVLIPNSLNEIRIMTGHNLATSYIDYDDMEFMNLILEFK